MILGVLELLKLVGQRTRPAAPARPGPVRAGEARADGGRAVAAPIGSARWPTLRDKKIGIPENWS
jgi:hypothetical protein